LVLGLSVHLDLPESQKSNRKPTIMYKAFEDLDSVMCLPLDLREAISCRILTIIADNCHSHDVTQRKRVGRSRSEDTHPRQPRRERGAPRSKSDTAIKTAIGRWDADSEGTTEATKESLEKSPKRERVSSKEDEAPQPIGRHHRERTFDHATPTRFEDHAPIPPCRSDSSRRLSVDQEQ
jgi:hypothetical protein